VTQNGADGATAPGAPVVGAAGTAAAEPAGDPPQGVVDLLGMLAYASLVAFFRLGEDAALAESLADKAALAEMAVAEFGHFRLLRDRIQELHVDPDQAMHPFVAAIDAFHARTAPSDWLESLVKAYVGDGIAADFYRTVAELLDPPTRDLVLEVLKDTGHAGFAVARVRGRRGQPAGRDRPDVRTADRRTRTPDGGAWPERLEGVAEPDAAGFGAANLQVGKLVRRNQDPAALVVAQDEDAAIGHRGRQEALDLIGRGLGLHD